MEVFLGQKQKPQEFKLNSISQLYSSSSFHATPCSSALARFSFDSGGAELRFHHNPESNDVFHVNLRTAQVFKLGSIESICITEGSEVSKKDEPVVDAFDPRLLVAPTIFRTIDITSVKDERLQSQDAAVGSGLLQQASQNLGAPSIRC